MNVFRFHFRQAATVTAIAVAAWVAVVVPRSADGATKRTTRSLGAVEFDKQSDYSHIRVHKQGSVRTLVFVRDHGDEAIQTMVNIKKPYELLGTYSRAMFTSYLLRPHPEQVLIVGLGGGAMVHFLKHYDPGVKVDALEIDPVVVRVADRYFDVRSEGNVKIITTNGVRYLEQTKNRYDVIYMDAFLRPSTDTDPTGKPLAMKTKQFYKEVRNRLTAGGLVVFNVNPHEKVEADLRASASPSARRMSFARPTRTSSSWRRYRRRGRSFPLCAPRRRNSTAASRPRFLSKRSSRPWRSSGRGSGGAKRFVVGRLADDRAAKRGRSLFSANALSAEGVCSPEKGPGPHEP